jgi:hypothetical protein
VPTTLLKSSQFGAKLCECRVYLQGQGELSLCHFAGEALVRDHLRSLVKVAYVDFERDESQRNPVVAYLQRYGSAKSAPISLTTEYHFTSNLNPSLYRTPSANEPYSKVSGDFNPIHTNPYLVAFASRYRYALAWHVHQCCH